MTPHKCTHDYYYDDPIGVDAQGGYYKCRNCKKEIYVKWGRQFKKLRKKGIIKD